MKVELQKQPLLTLPNLRKGLIRSFRRLLSGQFDTLTACIKKEVKFLPKSLRGAHSKIRSGWSRTAIRVIAEADEYLGQKSEPYPLLREEEEVIQLSSTEESESESEFKSGEEIKCQILIQ